MKRGPYYKTVSAIGHPVRTTMRSSAADNAIGGILIAAFWMMVGAVVLSPIWVPIWLVNEMYKEWHPVLATFVAVPFVISVIALYAWLYSLYAAREEVKAQPGQYDHITTVSQLVDELDIIESINKSAVQRENERKERAEDDLAEYQDASDDRKEDCRMMIADQSGEATLEDLDKLALELYNTPDPVEALRSYIVPKVLAVTIDVDDWTVEAHETRSNVWDKMRYLYQEVKDLAAYDRRQAGWVREDKAEEQRLYDLEDRLEASSDRILFPEDYLTR
jgi:hypothetical protein